MQANRLTLFLTVLQTASAEVFLRRHSQVTRATMHFQKFQDGICGPQLLQVTCVIAL